MPKTAAIYLTLLSCLLLSCAIGVGLVDFMLIKNRVYFVVQMKTE